MDRLKKLMKMPHLVQLCALAIAFSASQKIRSRSPADQDVALAREFRPLLSKAGVPVDRPPVALVAEATDAAN